MGSCNCTPRGHRYAATGLDMQVDVNGGLCGLTVDLGYRSGAVGGLLAVRGYPFARLPVPKETSTGHPLPRQIPYEVLLFASTVRP